MLQGRVEALRAAVAAFNRRDGEAFGAVFAEDAEIVPVRAAVDGTVYRARMLARRIAPLSRRFGKTSDGRSRSSAQAATGCLPWDLRGQGRYSGVDVDARAGWVARFRKGQVTNCHTYTDRADALDAVGLSE